MTTDQAQDYCKRKTTYVQKQQQGVQKVGARCAWSHTAEGLPAGPLCLTNACITVLVVVQRAAHSGQPFL